MELNYKTELKAFAGKYAKYRRYQAQLVKLREKGMKKPAAANNPKMMGLLANINALLKEMDADASRYAAVLKSAQLLVKGDPGEVVN